MIRLERKNINNKPYYYLSEQIKIGKKSKKIQVFVGKNIPKDTSGYFDKLEKKELKLVADAVKTNDFSAKHLELFSLRKIEKSKVSWKYFWTQLSDAKRKRLLRQFSTQFIYESNAIEGSKLSQSEVAKIIENKYVKKSIPEQEVIEVQNSISCFLMLLEQDFVLNQKSLKQLHSTLVVGLDIPTGFKKQDIVVNNKKTVNPKRVRAELTKLFAWYKSRDNKLHPFEKAVIFHNRFERVHPFTDGNGRVGRLLLNWMLFKEGYGFILVKNSNKTAYMRALDKGDEGQYRNILKFTVNTYANTIRMLL